MKSPRPKGNGSEPFGERAPARKGDVVSDQSLSDADHTLSDADQTASDADQTASDADEARAESDQAAADRDQATADREHAGRTEPGSGEYERSGRERAAATFQRLAAGVRRADVARGRDDVAAGRDATADERDEVSRQRDALAAETQVTAAMSSSHAALVNELINLRAEAAAERERAAADRARAASDRAEAALVRERLEAELRSAHLDSLTGAYRREMGPLAISHEIDRARRSNGSLVVAYVDVDGLKPVNDREGHAAGDRVLQAVVRLIRGRLRSFDLIIRYGGDEFVCVLGGTDAAKARQRFASIAWAIQEEAGVSISVGFAALQEGDAAEDLTARADEAMLAAKRGRHAAQ